MPMPMISPANPPVISANVPADFPSLCLVLRPGAYGPDGYGRDGLSGFRDGADMAILPRPEKLGTAAPLNGAGIAAFRPAATKRVGWRQSITVQRCPTWPSVVTELEHRPE
jgi:hypothetical protein